MSIFRRIAIVAVALALSVTFVAAGLCACLLPPVTQALSGAFAQDDVSPFSREQLARVADATREFSFGANDESTLLRVIYEVNREHADQVRADGLSLSASAPELDAVTDASDLAQLRVAFVGASEAYCFSLDAISHLDDCHTVLATATPVLVVCALISVVGLVAMGRAWGRLPVGTALVVSGGIVLAVFVLFGLWAAIDFDGLFTTFHQLFFSQGNWQFPYDCLLICALPTEFWMGMAGTWLATSIVVSVVALVVGCRLRANRPRYSAQ